MPTDRGSATLKNIAEMMGCSLATVSTAITGRGRMSEQRRIDVLAKCAEFNFVPNSAGRSLRLQRADAVGVIYAPSFAELFGNVFYARIMEGLAESFGEAGLDLILGNRTEEDGQPAIVRQNKVDALVVLAGVFEASSFNRLRNCRVPICIVDGYVASLVADTLTSDGFGGGLQVAEHLAGCGHRRAAMVAYKSPLYNIEQRIAGFLSGLRIAGIPAREEDVVIRVHDNDEASQILAERVKSDGGPTAVFAVNDTLAEHLIVTMGAAGIKVPQELSVVGFDDDPLAARCRPALTTVGMDKRAFGSVAARMVIDRLAEPKRPTVHRVQPTRLVVRDSVASL